MVSIYLCVHIDCDSRAKYFNPANIYKSYQCNTLFEREKNCGWAHQSKPFSRIFRSQIMCGWSTCECNILPYKLRKNDAHTDTDVVSFYTRSHIHLVSGWIPNFGVINLQTFDVVLVAMQTRRTSRMENDIWNAMLTVGRSYIHCTPFGTWSCSNRLFYKTEMILNQLFVKFRKRIIMHFRWV